MKKILLIAFIIFIIFQLFPADGATEQTDSDYEYEVIPDEAIRLRILPNSDSQQDQEIKHKVRNHVNKEISGWVEHMTDIDDARELIEQRIPVIREMVADVLEEEGYDKEFNVEYGKNVYFPMKLYGSYLYPAGEYEAILITIGEGEGDNWWCVLFPPLCFLDFSNGTSVASAEESESNASEEEENEEEEDTEVGFFLFDWIKKLFS